MSVEVKVESHLPEAQQALKMALKQWANRTGGELVNLTHRDRTQGGTPVDTGRLRNSMTYSAARDNKTVYVGSKVEYAEAVEEGARGRSGAHMLRNAVMDCKHDAKKYLKEALKDQNVY